MTTYYRRAPIFVTAEEITEENFDDFAKEFGRGTGETREGAKFITLDRNVTTHTVRAFIGWRVTRYDGNIRLYSPRSFENQFGVADPNDPELIAQLEAAESTEVQ